MIKLQYCHGKILVWNPEDIFTLREKYRIVGSLTGCYPVKPFQVQEKWLPLQLFPEEAKLLIDKGYAKLVKKFGNKPSSSKVEDYTKMRQTLCEEQVNLFREHRKQEILDKAEEIYEGKKRKLLATSDELKKQKSSENSNPEKESPDNSLLVEKDTTDVSKESSVEAPSTEPMPDSVPLSTELDKNAIIEAEIAKIKDIPVESTMVQLFTESPWDCMEEEVDWAYPSSERDQIRSAVFRDMWEKGYYLTAGTKFGGDFLAYEGEPLKYHATFIVVCLEASEKIHGHDIVMYGRLGRQVKKTVALASSDKGKVEYLTLDFENEVS